ncbi:hypothetical protein QWI17_17670 [Gilvimarinus sp. SDUM040013]|uniref:Uncharacterized protein n=1 Tax=Gilvimarinus gilvus TaxID=3058038 RepID=A0ABU4RXH7_9GAMM|nr:hypothetical protein [Gilvimarinus sp. SDUM040013]MDO3387677.1 hypothetical protein [Gilvimarinus sp. SDUM040013]MDX6848882.1 hypothetical protein [Gilvimarinus sp. SDUM040013]
MKHSGIISLYAALFMANGAVAHDQHKGGLQSPTDKTTPKAMDIVHAKVSYAGNVATFHMATAASAGHHKPKAKGELAGSEVYSYVWPTTLDTASVGFESDAGLLALAVTSHPDFDDTPLFDENSDGQYDNDGSNWHSHWVVLAPNEQCGAGALGVVDIPDGSTPSLPKTWPGLPILIDSPGWQPVFEQQSVNVRVPFDSTVELEGTQYDGVIAGLRVNQSVHAPLLCVVNVFDVASGDLSLPGIFDEQHDH